MTVWSMIVETVGAANVPTLLLFLLSVLGVVVPVVAIVTYRDLSRRMARLPDWTRYEHLAAEADRKRLEVGELESRRAELAERLEDLDQRRGEYAEMAARIEHAREEFRDLEERVAGLAPRREEIARAQAELKDVREELERLRAERGDHERAARAAEADAEQARRAVEDTERRVHELERRFAEAGARADAAEVDARDRERELAEATRRVAAERERATEVAHEIAALSTERDELQAAVAGLRSLKTTFEAWAERAGEQEGADRDRAKEDLFAAPDVLTSTALRRAAPVIDEEAALERFEGYLGDVGLSFAPRRVRAFHTALKIADISPLTVLAGISGTGKSELPRRYAEGMGLHFLQMAVQPRWDSPQDLFGFYNFLEKRFVATDLSRSLVHLDGKNHPDAAGPFADRMMVVLLDEMNLARVEYYFSEFLSRLEVRRSVNPDDPASRQQAEVVLDAGGGSARDEVRIFVGGNVLFVGTMNEDESTQTLSDKVNDRANVLRFGRPKTMRHAPPRADVPGAGAYLSYATWNGWKRTSPDLSREHRERLRGWIVRVNQELDRLGRPFGHRIAQAMEAYVANYPGVTRGRRLSEAFSDQLEQRVLPKLRGIDVEAPNDEPLGAIRGLVTELGDEPLAASIDRAMQTDALFQWQGVDRDE